MHSNAEIAAAFTELADRMAVTESKPFRLMAYHKAAELFATLPDSLEVLAREGTLKDLPGVGPAIREKVESLLATGTFPALEKSRAEVPDGLLALTKVSGVGVKTAVKVWNDVGAQTFADVVDAARGGGLATVPGVGAKVVGAVVAAADAADEATGPGRDGELAFLRDRVALVLDALEDHVRDELGDDAEFDATGEYARGIELPGGASVLVVVEQLASIDALATRLEERGWNLAHGPSPASDDLRLLHFVAPSGMPVDLWCATHVGAPTAGLAAVGPDVHAALVLQRLATGGGGTSSSRATSTTKSAGGLETIEVTARAAAARDASARGGGAGTAAAAGARATTATRPRRVSVLEPARPEDWIYASSGLQVVPPELRDMPDALELAASGDLPELVVEEQLIGELHCHSEWSDGKATILEMAVAAMQRGDRYMAITDHSAPYAMVGGLGEQRLLAQAEEVAKVNAELGGELTVLCGSEVEITGDGELGLPDHVLAKLDWAVASLHMGQRQSAEQVKARVEIALRNPLIDVIGHPTSRRLQRRPRTALDVGWLIEVAAETGTFLEINANPDRLDLDAEQARMALAAGVTLCIDSDAHRPSTLALRSHGVQVARRAGATAAQVANTFDLDALRTAQPRNRA